MVKKIQEKDTASYTCEACGFRYRDQNIALQCEAWCREHQSCNLEITKHGEPPESDNNY